MKLKPFNPYNIWPNDNYQIYNENVNKKRMSTEHCKKNRFDLYKMHDTVHVSKAREILEVNSK